LRGIDTNVLIRYLVQDDATQAKAATTFIEQHCTADDPGFVGHIVFCELAWVLESNYAQSRMQIATIIEELLQVVQMQAQDPEIIWRALNDYKKSNVDFPDHLLARINDSNGCDTTFTFDKKAAKQTGFELLN
jgi:predicted nucleic-acid-binding protein